MSELKIFNRRPLYGVGINDVDYHVERKVNGKREWICPYYRSWSNMFKRCYSPSSLKERPSYAKVRVDEEWFYLSAFKDWMQDQPWEGRQLDKDFLSGDKFIYSKETCIFIPNELNNFISLRRKLKLDLPIGVGQKEAYRKAQYSSNINNLNGKSRHLGNFVSPLNAHFTWIEAKIEYCDFYMEKIPIRRECDSWVDKN